MQGLFVCEEGVCGNDTGEVGACKELSVMGDVYSWLEKECRFAFVRCEQLDRRR